MANVVYNEYKEDMIKGTTVFPGAAGDYGVLLVTSAYTATETDDVAQAIAEEVATGGAGGYARKPLNNVAVTKVTVGATGTDDFFKVDADNAVFGPSVTISAAGAVIFKKDSLITDTPLRIITFVDFSGTKSSSAGDFTVVWNANGILNYKQGV